MTVKQDIFQYVKDYLQENDEERSPFPFRTRSGHIWRVFKWAERLIQEGGFQEKIDQEALLIAALFHDIGYGLDQGEGEHAAKSAKLFQEYATLHDFNKDQAKFITYLIANHSSKELLNNKETPLELVLLMEADLLDESGALSIAWDCMAEGIWGAESFMNAYDHIANYTCRIMKENPMQTPVAKKYWIEKQKLVDTFMRQLQLDLAID